MNITNTVYDNEYSFWTKIYNESIQKYYESKRTLKLVLTKLASSGLYIYAIGQEL